MPGMEDTMASTQSEVRALLVDQAAAMRTKDIDRLLSVYSPDVVYFDVVTSTPVRRFCCAPG